MIFRIFPFVLLGLGAAVAAQLPKADNCTPPPSAIAPALPAKLLPGMGVVHLAITTSNPEAQKFFDQGLAQMHSFWAREAERSFLQAAALDPDAPMPHWGVAMVAAGDWRPRFQIDLLNSAFAKQVPPAMSRARAAAGKALELSKAPGKATDLEKMYIAAVAARRDVNAKDGDDAFVKELRALVAAHPEEVEAQLDLALMIMRGFSLPDRKPIAPGTMEAVQILRSLLEKAPEHPGVHHYVIHGFEGSTFAKDAWPSCKRYSELVTNIPHAIHMPGHIYSQTGRWDDAVKSFSEAAVNERGWMKQDKLYGDGHHGHNVHYLAVAYSFEGKYDEALKTARELMAYPENPAQMKSVDLVTTAHAQGWFAMMRTLVQFEKWDAILDEQMLPAFGRSRQDAWRHWARALARANKGDVESARGESREFEAAMMEFRNKTHRVDPDELKVARQELAGQLVVAAGSSGRGLRMLEIASKAERRLTYTEPPYYPRPVAEVAGRVALKMNKPAAAERNFRAALQQYPADSHAVEGLHAALAQAGKPVVAGL